MATGYPPPVPPPQYDPRAQRRFMREQARAQRAAFRAQQQQIRYQMRSFRRGSVLGPILLIAIGVVFLLIQTGRVEHHQFWGWYAHWWPMLLVVAGLVVLAEWALDQFLLRDPQKPQYRRTLGGGAVVLLLFLVVVGVVANHGYSFHGTHDNWVFNGLPFNPDGFDEFFGDKHESDQNLDFAIAPGAALTIIDPRGDVTVNGTSDDGRVHVAIHKQVYAHSDADAESKAQQLVPTSSSQTNGITLTVPTVEGARADLTITAPGDAAMTVRANHGDIHVSSIKGPVTAIANHGDIDLSAVSGAAVAHINSSGSSLSARNLAAGITIQGRANDVTLSDVTGPVAMNGDFFGTTHLQQINGTVHFHTSRTDVQLMRLDGEADLSGSGLSADQVLGPAVFTTSNRNVTLDRVAGDLAVTDKNGSIELTAAPTLGNITLEDRNASIKLMMPEQSGFTLQAGTTNGDIETQLQQLSTSHSGNQSNVSGTVGDGGPLVRVTTTNGDITINKAEVQPVPLKPPAPPKITMNPAANPETTGKQIQGQRLRGRPPQPAPPPQP